MSKRENKRLSEMNESDIESELTFSSKSDETDNEVFYFINK